MTTIKLNPQKLDDAIRDLRQLADASDEAKKSIDREFEKEHDPFDVSGFISSAASRIASLRARADEISSAKDTIVRLNESGIASTDPQGNISYDAPPDVDVNSLNNLIETAQAAIDAKDLERALSGKRSEIPERTYDEIIASMEAHRNNVAYANAFIWSIGPENLTRFPLLMPSNYSRELCSDPENAPDKQAELLGHLLSTASHSWDSKRSQEVTSKIVESVDQTEEYGRLTVINRMLGGHDIDNDRSNDLVFKDSFLVTLAEGLEKLDHEIISAYQAEGKGHIGRYLGDENLRTEDDPSLDPLAGVLDAMGNNPNAALTFLTKANRSPDGDHISSDMSRLEALSRRHWDEDGFAGFTAAIAAASSKRSSTSPGESDLASALSGHAIHYLSQNTKEEIYNDDAKTRIGVLAANCSPEVTEVLNSGKDPLNPQTATVLPAASSKDVHSLLYRIADNSDATATISAGLADYSYKRSQAGILAHQGDAQAQLRSINETYNQGLQAAGYLAGLADGKADEVNENNDEEAAARTESARTAVNVFSTVATAGLSEIKGPIGAAAKSTYGGAAVSIINTLAAPIIVDALDGPAAEHIKSAVPLESDAPILAAAVRDAANAGLLDPQDYNVPRPDDYSWIIQREDGTHYIDLSKVQIDELGEVSNWTNIVNDPSRSGDPALDQLQDDFDGAYSTGYVKGDRFADNQRR